jgi:hypothetical protein
MTQIFHSVYMQPSGPKLLKLPQSHTACLTSSSPNGIIRSPFFALVRVLKITSLNLNGAQVKGVTNVRAAIYDQFSTFVQLSLLS